MIVYRVIDQIKADLEIRMVHLDTQLLTGTFDFGVPGPLEDPNIRGSPHTKYDCVQGGRHSTSNLSHRNHSALLHSRHNKMVWGHPSYKNLALELLPFSHSILSHPHRSKFRRGVP